MNGSQPVEANKPGKKTLAERIAGLTSAQRALYELRTRHLGNEKEKPRIPLRQDPKPWLASTDQAALWFIQELDPATSAYNIGNGYRLRGKLDVALLERCLNQVTRRHHILRTTFTSVDGKPYQVLSDRQFTVPVTDVRSEPDPESAAQARAAALIREPFDLEKGPLLRLPLVRVADHEYIFIGVFHHIITDWWSYHLFFAELFALYTAFACSRPDPLPELPIQYADWAAWRDQWEESGAFAQQEDYWLRKLEGIPYVIEIPTDRPRPRVQSHCGAREFFQFSPALAERVRRMNSRADVSSFMTLLAGLNAFLFRYTGQEEFLVGTPVSADRDTQDTANLIGYMLNIVVLRADLTGDPSFLQVLERARCTCMEAFAHKEFPFRRLVQRLKPERDMSRMPLYQIEYVYTSAESPVQQSTTVIKGALELHGCEIHPLSIDRKTSPVDLQIAITGARDQFNLMIEYNTDIFDSSTIRRFGHQMVAFLDNVLTDPETPVSMVPLLSSEETNLAVKTLNSSFRETPETTITELFEAQTERCAHAVALIVGNDSFTYQELNERSNRLAHHLIRDRLGPERIAGICLARSMEMLVAILAVFKTGAGYLPLDPEYPTARLQQMMSDARPLMVLSSGVLLGRLPALAPVLALDHAGTQASIETMPSHNPADSDRASPLLPGNIAYVIYTSGSTGIPKGVMVEHRNAASFAIWARSVFTAHHWAGMLASTSICFDMSFFELVVTLVHGGTVILSESALELPDLPAREKVRVINTVPAVAESLLDSNALPSDVQIVNLGGEVLRGSLVRRLHHRRRLDAVYNLYGPTETTTYSTMAVCLAGSHEEPTIGFPLSNTRAYVLDARLQHVPVGMTGELYLAGDGVSRGYLNSPELTACKFFPDAYAMVPGKRMYRTGDLVRWRNDGQIEFLGRADRQLKLRGLRIEPAEIETVLLGHSGIRQAAVIASEIHGESKQLVAYLAPAPGANLEPAVVLSWLSERVPAYMVPAAIMVLALLPLKPNGKLDAAALPAPSKQSETYRPPRTLHEKILTRILREVLSIHPIGLDDNFFHLGGDSILCLQVVARARREGLNLTSRDIFQHKTVEMLASIALQRQ